MLSEENRVLALQKAEADSFARIIDEDVEKWGHGGDCEIDEMIENLFKVKELIKEVQRLRLPENVREELEKQKKSIKIDGYKFKAEDGKTYKPNTYGLAHYFPVSILSIIDRPALIQKIKKWAGALMCSCWSTALVTGGDTIYWRIYPSLKTFVTCDDGIIKIGLIARCRFATNAPEFECNEEPV